MVSKNVQIYGNFKHYFFVAPQISFFSLSFNFYFVFNSIFQTPLNSSAHSKGARLLFTHIVFIFFVFESSLLNYTAAIFDSCGGVVMLVSIIFAILLKYENESEKAF